MAVFRVERIKDYTVMSNHHLRNKNLSLKAKGLLSQMLSLPDDWDYTLKGLAAINKESVDAIRTAIWELEDAGYVVRTRVRDERGCLRGCDYYVYEYPQTPSSGSGGSAESVPPMLEPHASDSAVLGNPMQLNKEIQNKEKQNTDLILSEGAAVRTKVRDNIELDLLCRSLCRQTYCRILHSVSSGDSSVPRRSRHIEPRNQSSFCHSRSPLSAEKQPHTHTHSQDSGCCPPQIRSKVRFLFLA